MLPPVWGDTADEIAELTAQADALIAAAPKEKNEFDASQVGHALQIPAFVDPRGMRSGWVSGWDHYADRVRANPAVPRDPLLEGSA
jgi:hypothetical protein